MSDPWAGEGQLEAIHPSCRCYGRLGCGHDVPVARGRYSLLQADADARLLEIGGFDLSTVAYRQPELSDLPRIIPAVDGTTAAQGVFRPWVTVMLKDWLTADAAARFESPQRWLGLPDDVRVLLTLFASDRELEWLWRERRQFLRALDRFPPSAVATPSYSTWDGDPWTEHRYQIKRSIEFVRLLHDHGHAAVPHVSWGRQLDAEDVARWLNDNAVRVVAIDAQCLGRGFRAWLGQLDWLGQQLIEPPTLIVGGLRAPGRLSALLRVWPNTRAIYNGLRTAGAHRELRVRRDGGMDIVRFRSGSDALRPGLWASGDEDPSPGILYQRSLRALESTVPPIDINAGQLEPVTAMARRSDDGLVVSRSRPGAAPGRATT